MPPTQEQQPETEMRTTAGPLATHPQATDLNRATSCTPEVRLTIEDMFLYHSWTPQQEQAGIEVRNALLNAAATIINNVPPGPDRTVAIRKLREARMDANSAITHGGRY